MNLNLIEQLDIKGHLTISKLFRDGSEEIVFDDPNIIVSGMGVALAHLFALSGSPYIYDYQIDRFQLGVSGGPELQVSSTYQLSSPLVSSIEYTGSNGNVIAASGNIIKNNSIVTSPASWYGIIPPHNVTRIDSTTVRYTIFIDDDSCNNLTRNSSDAYLSEIGLFIRNIKFADPVAPILVAYRSFTKIRKTSDFGLIFRWSINF